MGEYWLSRVPVASNHQHVRTQSQRPPFVVFTRFRRMHTRPAPEPSLPRISICRCFEYRSHPQESGCTVTQLLYGAPGFRESVYGLYRSTKHRECVHPLALARLKPRSLLMWQSDDRNDFPSQALKGSRCAWRTADKRWRSRIARAMRRGSPSSY